MLIICNGTVLTLDEHSPAVRNGAVVIDGESIKEIGPCEEMLGHYHDAELIDAHGGIIMPGLVNARMRSANILSTRETGRSKQLAFDKRLTLKTVRYASFAASIECIKNGVTTVFDTAFVPADTAGTLQTMFAAYFESGIRCCLSYETSELLGSERMRAAAEENADFINYCNYYRSPAAAASFGIGPVSEQSGFALQLIKASAQKGAGFTVRLDAKNDKDSPYKKSEIERLAENGLLNGKTIVYESGELSHNDLEIIRSTGSMVCLASAADVRSGIPGLCGDELESSAVEFCLGTGSCSADMFEAARSESFYSAVRCYSGAAKTTARALLKTNPAFAGKLFGCRIGSLTPGASADVIVLDVDLPYRDDTDMLIDQLVRRASGRACIHTVSRGRVLMKDRRILSVDEERLSKEIAAVRSSMTR